MHGEDVGSFVEQASDALAATPAMGKRNTELRVVEPFLSTLGWDVRSPAVTAAYLAPNGTMVDYALCPDGSVGAFVVTAAAAEDLSRERGDELLAAMRAADVPRGAYTNGRQFVLFALTEGGAERVQLALGELPERTGALAALSHDAVAAATGGGAEAVADALVAAERDAVDAVTDTVLDVARDHGAGDVDGVAADVRSLVRRFLDALVDDLAPEGSGVERDASTNAAIASESRSDAPRDEDGDAPGEEDGTEPGDADKNMGDGARTLGRDERVQSLSAASGSSEESPNEDSDEEFVLRFFKDGRSVGAVGSTNVPATVAQGVQYLLVERGIGPRLEFPYAPGDEDRAFLHREPVHPDGSRMTAAIDLDGLYVYTGADVASLRAALEALAECGGLEVMFSGDWQ